MVDVFSCILDFPIIPPYKANTSIKPSKSFFKNNSSQRQKKKQQQQPTTKKKKKKKKKKKQSQKTLSLGYTEIEKRRRALGQNLFCVICN